MSIDIRTHAVDYLFDAILSLKDREECYAFFEDICTVNEILSLSQRFEVAAMLRSKKNLPRDSRQDRCEHCYHQPCEPFTELRKRRL